MTQEQINLLADITARYTKLKVAADEAEKSIRNVKFELFTDFIPKEELDILEKARMIMCHISGKTDSREAVKYFENLNK